MDLLEGLKDLNNENTLEILWQNIEAPFIHGYNMDSILWKYVRINAMCFHFFRWHTLLLCIHAL